MTKTKIFIFTLILSVGLQTLSYADGAAQDRLLGQAKQVLVEMMASPDQSIPEELLAKCRAVAIYPFVLKGGFLVGGRYGQGSRFETR